MHHSFKNSAILLLVFVIATFALSFKTKKNNTVNNFSLININGKLISTANYLHAKGFIIVFTCNHCPFAKLYTSRLNALQQKYANSGVPLLAINSIDSVLFEEENFWAMQEKAVNEQFEFPYLYDPTQMVAKDFNAQKTPHAYVIWKVGNKWVIKYNGAIDDNGAEPQRVKNHYVADAVEALLANKKVDINEASSIGCQIMFRKK
jgi:peroxiredoxin